MTGPMTLRVCPQGHEVHALKACRRCGNVLHRVYGFAPSTAGTKDGRMGVCRGCFNTRRRAAYARKQAA